MKDLPLLFTQQQSSGERYVAAMLEKYFQTLSRDDLADYRRSLEHAESAFNSDFRCLSGKKDQVIG